MAVTSHYSLIKHMLFLLSRNLDGARQGHLWDAETDLVPTRFNA